MSICPIQLIATSLIKCGVNIRMIYDQEKIKQLAASIKETGQMMPLIVWHDGNAYLLVDGHRRFAAVQLLGWEYVEVRVLDRPPTAGEALVKALVCNLQRENLSPIATARGIAELMQMTGCTASEAAKQLALSPATVSRLTGLLALPANLIELVESGKIAVSKAYELARVADPGQQADLARQAAAQQITRDGINAQIKRCVKPHKADGVRKAVATLGDGRSLTVSAPFLTLDTFIGVIEGVLTRARRTRSRGVELDTFLRMLRDEAKAAPNAAGENGSQP